MGFFTVTRRYGRGQGHEDPGKIAGGRRCRSPAQKTQTWGILRQGCLLLWGLFLTLAYSGQVAASAPPSPPNIILVVGDDLGWGAFGVYGQTTVPARTPAIDTLAAEGVRFTQFYAGSSVCAPSRCSLVTGRHTGTCGIRGNYVVPMAPEEPTMASRLKALGYRTAMVGKWGLGENGSDWAPRQKGFDYFFGFTSQGEAHNYYPEWVWENETRYPLAGNRARFRVAVEKTTYVNDVFIEKALRFIEDNRDAPIFLYLPLTLPHTNSELEALTGSGMEAPRNYYADVPGLDPKEQIHASMIREIDRTVAAVANKLRALGLTRRSLVLVTSDNGSAPYYDRNNRFNENGGLRGKKGTLYEGGIRVPLVVWGPGYTAQGQVVDHPAAAWDLLPTFLQLAGDAVPDRNLPGESLLKSLTGEAGPGASDRPLYWELHVPPLQQAVRLGDWKLIRIGGPKGTMELFNLAEDPSESRNLVQQHFRLAAALEGRFDALRRDDPRWPLARFAGQETPENNRSREGYDPRLPAGLPSQGPIRLVEIDPPRGSYYRSHLYYWSEGRVDSLEIYENFSKAEDKGKFLDDTLLPFMEHHPRGQFVFARQVGGSAVGRALERFAERHGWQLEVIHRYVERYSTLPGIELIVLKVRSESNK